MPLGHLRALRIATVSFGLALVFAACSSSSGPRDGGAGAGGNDAGVGGHGGTGGGGGGAGGAGGAHDGGAGTGGQGGAQSDGGQDTTSPPDGAPTDGHPNDATDGGQTLAWRAFLPLAMAAPGSGQASGTTLDLSPNHYDATYFGTTLRFANGSLNLTGAGSELVLVPPKSGGPAVDVTGSYSVSAWVTMTDVGGFQTFVSGEGLNIASFFLQKRADTNAFAFTTTANDDVPTAGGCIAPGPATDGGAAPNPVIPVVGQQYYLTATRDATTGLQILYVNGVESGRNTCVAGFTDTGILGIGHGLFAGNRGDYVRGAIAEVGVINRVLTPAEITALFNKGHVGGQGGADGGAGADGGGGAGGNGGGPGDGSAGASGDAAGDAAMSVDAAPDAATDI